MGRKNSLLLSFILTAFVSTHINAANRKLPEIPELKSMQLTNYWKLNDGKGQLIKDSVSGKCSGWLGKSGKSNEENDPQWEMMDNKALLDFTGASYVQLKNKNDYNFTDVNKFAIQLQFKMTDKDTQKTSIIFACGAFSNPNSWHLYISKGFLRFVFKKGKTVRYQVMCNAKRLRNSWNRVTVTGDGKELKLYLNGSLSGKVKCDGMPSEAVNHLKIGCYPWKNLYGFKGQIRDLKIFKAKEKILANDFKKLKNITDWHVLSGNWKLADGYYCERSEAYDKEYWTIAGEKKWKNYCFSINVKNPDAYGSMLMGFGWQDINNHYELEHQSFNPWLSFLRLWKVEKGVRTLLSEIDNRQGHFRTSQPELFIPRNSKKAFNYQVYFFQGTIAVKANDCFYLAVKDNTFSSGKVAIGTLSRVMMVEDVTVAGLNSFSCPVKIKDMTPKTLAISQKDLRHSFYRGENIKLDIDLKNLSSKKLENAVVKISVNNIPGLNKTLKFKSLAAGDSAAKMVSIDTKGLKSGNYKITAKLNDSKIKQQYDILIAPVPLKDRYLFQDLQGESNEGYWETLKKYGFNVYRFYTHPESNYKRARSYFAKVFDRAVKYGFKVGFAYTSAYGESNRGEDTRTIRMNGAKSKYLNQWNPAEQRFQKKMMRQFMDVVKNYPALSFVNISEEVDCSLEVSYGEGDKKRAKKELGFELPSPTNKDMDIDGNAGRVAGVPHKVRLNTPAVFSDNNKWYRFFKWYWLKGVGDIYLNSLLKKEIKETSPETLVGTLPFRAVPLAGRKTGQDIIGGWFYALPDPAEALGQIEIFKRCAVEGDKVKKVNYNPSLFLYSNKICPPVDKSRWVGVQPTDYIIEADWIGFSRRPDLMGHWTLVYAAKELLRPNGFGKNYPKDITEKIGKFSHEILQPLWPAVSKLNKVPRKCAFLISFGSQIFGYKIWSGYGGTSGFGYYAALQKAHIPADIIFDETIKKGGLDKYKVLFMHKITHLPESVYKRIVEFAKKGGTVICGKPFSDMIPGAVNYDMNMKQRLYYAYAELLRGKGVTGDVLQKTMDKHTADVKKIAFDKVKPYADCNSPKVFLNLLKKGDAKFLFVINDKRTFGDYLGKKYRICMEKGLPQDVTISLNQTNCVVYDLVSHQQLKTIEKNGKTLVDLKLKPAWGALLAIYPRGIKNISIKTPKQLKPGEKTSFAVNITDSDDKNISGVQPLEITITDPAGKRNEYSNYYAAVNGVCEINFIPAVNDLHGKWKISIVELSSGKKAEVDFSY